MEETGFRGWRLSRLPFALFALLAGLALMGLMSVNAAAQIYDAASDFSPINNPNGVWSYGEETSRGATFNLYSIHTKYGVLDEWLNAGSVSNDPGVWHNPFSYSVNQGYIVPAGGLAFHPGYNGENSVVRWTAPDAGTLVVSGYFMGDAPSPVTTTDVAVLYNSTTTLFSGNIDSYNVPLPFSESVKVAAGDTLDFNVGDGNDHSYRFDTTGIDATIGYVPVLSAISPPTTDAGGKTVTLTVKGSNFSSTSTVNWNSSTLSTTYVSSDLLNAEVPASLIAAPGKAEVSVTTPDVGTSRSKPFTMLQTTLKLTGVQISKYGSGNYVALISLRNVGYLTATTATVTKATLNGAAATNLPLTVGDIASAATPTASLTFPAATGASGQKVVLKIVGTFTGGTFSGSATVTLP
jgi:hypothetical protein